MRLLLIDENPSECALTQLVLGKEFPNLTIDVVTSALAFADAFARADFDVVLTEQKIQWGDALEMVRSVKNRFPETPVILFSGPGSEKLLGRAKTLGFDYCIYKAPENYTTELTSAVRECLKEATSSRTRRAIQGASPFSLMLERLGIGAFQADQQGKITNAGAPFLRLLGYETVERVKGVPLGELMVREEDRSRFERWLNITDLSLTDRVDVPLRCTDGRRVRVHLALSRSGGAGRPVVIEGFVDGYSERQGEEEKLKERLEELSRSNNELSEFAHVASHELKEPLRTVQRSTQLLAMEYKGRLDPDADELLTHASEAAGRMESLISSLLRHAEAGEQPHMLTRVECSGVIDQAKQNLAALIEDSGALVEAKDLPAVLADESLLLPLFQNLIANGIRFNESDRPQVKIGAKEEESDWIFSVADNGIGIESRDQERIFEIFQRGRTPLGVPGSGIGLSICRRAVESHGGRIWVESKPKKGTTFYFTLPKHSDADQEAPGGRSPASEA